MSQTLARTLTPLVGLALLGSSALGQNSQLMLRRNDQVIGNGKITLFDQIAVNNSGFFYSQVQTDDPDSDEVLLLNGFMVMGKGINVASPVNALYRSANGGSMTVNDSGYIGWALSLSQTNGKEDDLGLYWNTLLLAQEGSRPFTDNVGGIPFTTAATGTLDTIYSSFTLARLNDKEQLLVLGALDDDGFKGAETCASILTTDKMGNLIGEEFLAVRRYPFPGTGDEVDSVSTSSVTWDFNDRSDWIGQVVLKKQVGGARISSLLVNGAVALEAGTESPGHPGRNIVGFSSMSVNNHGDYVVSTIFDGEKATDSALVMNGSITVVTESDVFQGISPHRVNRFDGAPVEITDSRDVFWYAQTSNVPSQERYYFRSVYSGNNTWTHKVIAQQGVTIAAGSPISDLRTTQSAFAVSDNGRFWVGEVLLANSNEALLSADFGASVPLYGCADPSVHQGTLQKVLGDPLIGNKITYHVEGPIMLGSSPILLWSTQPAIPGSSCGIRSGKKEFMINPTKPQNFAKMVGAAYTGAPVVFEIDLPLDPALVDMTIYGQAAFVRDNGMLRLTPGVAVTVGQPN